MNQSFIYLASASPRRRELLTQIGVAFRAVPANLPERRDPGEAATDFVQRMALAKARHIQERTPGERAPVLGADTVVMVDGDMLGKPEGREDALRMLARLAGREHEVLSAVAVVSGEQSNVGLDVSRVWFRKIDSRERAAYWETGEPADKAGAYAVQGIGAVFIERIEGSFSGVMGLPLYLTAQLLEDAGFRIPGLAGAKSHA